MLVRLLFVSEVSGVLRFAGAIHAVFPLLGAFLCIQIRLSIMKCYFTQREVTTLRPPRFLALFACLSQSLAVSSR